MRLTLASHSALAFLHALFWSSCLADKTHSCVGKAGADLHNKVPHLAALSQLCGTAQEAAAAARSAQAALAARDRAHCADLDKADTAHRAAHRAALKGAKDAERLLRAHVAALERDLLGLRSEADRLSQARAAVRAASKV